eukprot:1851023-Amphidinium_carterae.1
MTSYLPEAMKKMRAGAVDTLLGVGHEYVRGRAAWALGRFQQASLLVARDSCFRISSGHAESCSTIGAASGSLFLSGEIATALSYSNAS